MLKTVSDNCQLSSAVFGPANFNCNQQGVHVVTLTATDNSGNTSTAQFTVTVVDNLPPVMICPDDIYRCAGNDVVIYTAPSVEDNCQTTGGTFSLDAGLPSGSQFQSGVTTNIYSFVDAAGNRGECSFDVIILEPLAIAASSVINDIDNQSIGSINITVTGGLQPYNFVWTKNGQPFATTEDLQNVGMGAYTVVVTDANDCPLVTQSFEVQSLVDASEPSDWRGAFQLVPNPTSGWLLAKFPAEMIGKEASVFVRDATGRLLRAENFNVEPVVQLDLLGFSDGLYQISVLVDGQPVHRRVVLARN